MISSASILDSPCAGTGVGSVRSSFQCSSSSHAGMVNCSLSASSKETRPIAARSESAVSSFLVEAAVGFGRKIGLRGSVRSPLFGSVEGSESSSDGGAPLPMYPALLKERLLARLAEGLSAFEPFLSVSDPELSLCSQPDTSGAFAELPSEFTKKTSYTRWKSALKSHLYRTRTVTMLKCSALKQTSRPDESEGDFRARLDHAR